MIGQNEKYSALIGSFYLYALQCEQPLAGEHSQAPADPVTVEDEDDLEDEEGNLLELLDILPVLGGIEPLLNRGRVKFADMVGDEGEVTRTQGVQTEQDQVIKRVKGNFGHDHNLLEDVILLLAYHSYHRFSALDSEHI